MDNSNVYNALNTVNELIPLVNTAESQFKSARNWSFLDLLGGSTIVDLIKHYKLGKAGSTMNDINFLLQRLSNELGNIQIPDDYRMNMGGFLTFADFVFDGFFVDAYMTSKILSSINEIQKLKNRLYSVKEKLESMR